RVSAPARIAVDVRIVRAQSYAANALSEDGFAIFGLWPALFGMVIESAQIATVVSIEKDGVVYRGRDVSELEGSLFAPAERRALGLSLRRALNTATPSLAASPDVGATPPEPGG
ncbi:MAG TPA: hypothetical protein VL400_22715, partial [Polyangiaceae bacterium]|nr:hypothetical protein [Polyangiaceae bacterium]